MARSSLLDETPISGLWSHFVALDVTHTFTSLFSGQLSTLCDRREFSARMGALMRQWRAEQWEKTFINSPGKGDNRGCRKKSGSDRRSDDVALQQQRQRNVAAYYESVRVQRLMEEVLLFPQAVGNGKNEKLEESMKEVSALHREQRRRRGLIRAVDEVWRTSQNATDFLLPVTEWEAPLYYRHIKRPVCVASLYCSVWDTVVNDYAGLKSLLTLMRTNCETYNGAGSSLMAVCQELVNVGYRAARDAQTDEELEEAQKGGLVIPPSLVLEAANGIGSSSFCGASSGVAGGRLLATLTAAELAEMFPPRYDAAAPPINNDTVTEKGDNGIGSSGEPRRVLRLFRKPAGGKLEEPPVVSDNSTIRTLRLRVASKPADSVATVQPPVREQKQDEKGEEKNSVKQQPKKQKKETQGDIIYWVRCDGCDTWRVVPEEIEPSTPHWECSFLGLDCKPRKAKRKREDVGGEKKSKTEKCGKTRKNGVLEKDAKPTGKGRSKRNGEVPDLKREAQSVACRNDGRHDARNAGRASTKTSASKAKGKSKGQKSTVSRQSHASSASTCSSSYSSSSEDSESSCSTVVPPKRVRDSRRKKASTKSTSKRGRKCRRAPSTSSSSSFSSSSSSSEEEEGVRQTNDGGGKGAHPLARASSSAPVLTAEKLVELEAKMDEVDAMSFQNHNPKEILARLRSLERSLRCGC